MRNVEMQSPYGKNYQSLERPSIILPLYKFKKSRATKAIYLCNTDILTKKKSYNKAPNI